MPEYCLASINVRICHLNFLNKLTPTPCNFFIFTSVFYTKKIIFFFSVSWFMLENILNYLPFKKTKNLSNVLKFLPNIKLLNILYL